MKKRHTTEEIITHLRSIERMLAGGATVGSLPTTWLRIAELLGTCQ